MKKFIMIAALALAAISSGYARDAAKSQWYGKHVGYLGDSMTDPRNSASQNKYWTVLKDIMGIEPHVYARSGFEWSRLLSKAKEMRQEVGDSIDAVIIWCGTNDYNHNRPIGEFFSEKIDSVNHNGKMVARRHRQWNMDDTTFCGSINRVMHFLKDEYPTKQIIIMTPIHRGFATFNEKNVQPDEDYSNGQGLFLEDYVDVLKRAATLWAVPLIDMHSLSGIYPNFESNAQFIANDSTDRLHPNDAGHYRIARTLQTQLEALPVGF